MEKKFTNYYDKDCNRVFVKDVVQHVNRNEVYVVEEEKFCFLRGVNTEDADIDYVIFMERKGNLLENPKLKNKFKIKIK